MFLTTKVILSWYANNLNKHKTILNIDLSVWILVYRISEFKIFFLLKFNIIHFIVIGRIQTPSLGFIN